MFERLMQSAFLRLAVSGLILFGGTTANADLVGHWTFDDDTINDSSGNNYNGSLAASGSYDAADVPTQLAGGKSLNLTASDAYAIIDSAGAEAPFDLPYGLTVSAWVKGWPNNSWEPFVSKRGENGKGWQLRRRGSSASQVFTLRGHGNEDPQSNINLKDNPNWKHVVGTFDGWTRATYVDGVLDRIDNDGGQINNSDNKVVFGARDYSDVAAPNVGYFSQIRIDDVAIFSGGLSPNQVAYLAGGGDPASLPAAPSLALPKGTVLSTALNDDGVTWNVYARIPTTATWDQHRVNAQKAEIMGTPGHLATIKNAAENDKVLALTSGYSFIGLTDSTGTSNLDGYDFAANLGTAEAGTNPTVGWKWVDGSNVGDLVYSNWNSGEPNDASSEDIAQINTNGKWYDHNAGGSVTGGGTQSDYRTVAIIEFDVNATTKPDFSSSSTGSGQHDPITGHTYERMNVNLTWDQSRVVADQRQLGGARGHLATISDAAENEIVRNAGGTGNKWIGMTDSTQASTIDGFDASTLGAYEAGGSPTTPGDGYVWVTGEAVTFQNWSSGEPNNSGGEDAAQITSGGTWNDHRAGGSLGETNTMMNSVIEYDIGHIGTFHVVERKANVAEFGSIDTMTDARALLALPAGDPGIEAEATAEMYAISFFDPQQATGRGEYLRVPFLTDTGAADDDFVVQATAQIGIPEAGDWTFAVSHDDNFELTVGSNTFASSGCCGNPTLINGADVFTFASEGIEALDLIWFENGGGAGLQLFAAQGDHNVFDPVFFRLVGDWANGGLRLVPEPSTLLMASFFGLFALALGWRRRKKR